MDTGDEVLRVAKVNQKKRCKSAHHKSPGGFDGEQRYSRLMDSERGEGDDLELW